MRKSLLVSILFLTVAGCGDNPIGPDNPVGAEQKTVRANLIIEYDRWDQPREERRAVRVREVLFERCGSYQCERLDYQHFENLPQDGPVEISIVLACSGDRLHERILVTAYGVTVSDHAGVRALACTEEPQIVRVSMNIPFPTGAV